MARDRRVRPQRHVDRHHHRPLRRRKTDRGLGRAGPARPLPAARMHSDRIGGGRSQTSGADRLLRMRAACAPPNRDRSRRLSDSEANPAVESQESNRRPLPIVRGGITWLNRATRPFSALTADPFQLRLRTVCRSISTMTAVDPPNSITPFMAAIDPSSRQQLQRHDFVAECRVVHEREVQDVGPAGAVSKAE